MMTLSSPPPRRSASTRPCAKLLTVHQAAELLLVCDKTVRRLITAGQLRCVWAARSASPRMTSTSTWRTAGRADVMSTQVHVILALSGPP